MAKVDLSSFGYGQVHVSFNGAPLKLNNGDIIDNDDLVSLYPQYFKVSEQAPVEVAPEAPAELLTEESASVEVSIEETIQDIIEDAVQDAVQAIEEVKEVKTTKKGK
jgi:hypothetical protein